MKCQVAAIQWGGGSSRNFRSSSEAVQIQDSVQWGGGVVAEFFSWSPNADAIQWGGGSSRILA